MSNITMAGVIWWPHSGGRWLCRSILKKHSSVLETALVHPWIFNTSDMTLDLDITAQVHKARSLPELKLHLNALKESTDFGRIQGLKYYFDKIRETYISKEDHYSHIVGEVCLGSPIPKYADLKSVYQANPEFKTIHLVRNPVESFPSFTSRHELDDDPVKVAGSWLALNAGIRKFFELNNEYSKQYLLVKYEDLVNNPRAEVLKICKFLEIGFEEEMIASIEERWGRSTKPVTSEQDKNTIEEVAFSELKKYGYL